jgi:hypothetical protein
MPTFGEAMMELDQQLIDVDTARNGCHQSHHIQRPRCPFSAHPTGHVPGHASMLRRAGHPLESLGRRRSARGSIVCEMKSGLSGGKNDACAVVSGDTDLLPLEARRQLLGLEPGQSTRVSESKARTVTP